MNRSTLFLWKQKFFAYSEGFFIKKSDRIMILDEMATLLNSGIRIVDALILIEQQVSSSFVKRLLGQIAADVQNGALLSQAMAKHPHIFPEKWTNLIRSGEKSGKLEAVLTDLAEDEQEQAKLMATLKSAMVYPVFVLLLTVILLAYMLLVIVPEIAQVYAKMRQDLPSATQFIIDLSDLAQEQFLTVLGLVIAIIVITKIFSGISLSFRMILDWLQLHMPIFGPLRKKQNIALFAGNLSLLLQSGVLAVDALGIVESILPSPLYRREVARIKEGVRRGNKISQEMGLIDLKKGQFKKNSYFPLQVAQMIRIGEETGKIAALLQKMKVNMSNQIHLTLKSFSSLFEPLMIIFVGVMVGGVLLAVILPFFSLKV